ncbi:glycosyltransferase [Denitromonas ohlonensis]|uniref:Glycosyltransferase n=2 Tax=Denitromonas TaxID=139331 RepID=A0A557RSI1_9RHOO|nr:glycosyltransferase [Denitromonas ohlonensis]TVO68106.1 glycosyltransferase [Denitromonas ohlonensis]TVO77989.1 glycosyltransferase [Denitromonas ohlonensis]
MTAHVSDSSARSILMAVDQLPFPPRNGVTLPTFNYAEGLMKSHRLRLVLLADEANPVDQAALAENEAIFGEIAVIRVRRRHKLKRVVDELLGRDMFNQGWECLDASPELAGVAADVFLVSPYSAAAKWLAANSSGVDRFGCRIAAVSDCTAAEYFYRGTQDFGGLKLTLKARLDKLRASRVAVVEQRTLGNFDHVLMQTKTDQQLMKSLVGEGTAARVAIVPNGVRRDFFDIRRDGSTNKVVFVAELSGEYAAIADWLVRVVWPAVIARSQTAQLLIIGKGASAELREAIRCVGSAEHVDFVDDLRSVYASAAVVICPVFKGYGLINKALEAMASGVPVVGGVAAFNGIEGFVDRVHGFVCRPRNTEDFAMAISEILSNPVRADQVGSAGRTLIEDQFRWASAIQRIEALMPHRSESGE